MKPDRTEIAIALLLRGVLGTVGLFLFGFSYLLDAILWLRRKL